MYSCSRNSYVVVVAICVIKNYISYSGFVPYRNTLINKRILYCFSPRRTLYRDVALEFDRVVPIIIILIIVMTSLTNRIWRVFSCWTSRKVYSLFHKHDILSMMTESTTSSFKVFARKNLPMNSTEKVEKCIIFYLFFF